MIIHDSRIARKMRAVFEADWSEAAPDKKKAEKKEIKKVLKAAEAVARPGRLPRLRAALGA